MICGMSGTPGIRDRGQHNKINIDKGAHKFVSQIKGWLLLRVLLFVGNANQLLSLALCSLFACVYIILG